MKWIKKVLAYLIPKTKYIVELEDLLAEVRVAVKATEGAADWAGILKRIEKILGISDGDS